MQCERMTRCSSQITVQYSRKRKHKQNGDHYTSRFRYGTALGSASGDVWRARGDADGDADTRRSAVPVRAVTEAADDGTASRFALGGRGCDDVDDEVACERGGDGAGTVSDGRGE